MQFAAAESQLLFFLFFLQRNPRTKGFVVLNVIWRRLSDSLRIIMVAVVMVAAVGAPRPPSQKRCPQVSLRSAVLSGSFNACGCCLFIFMPDNYRCFIPFVCVPADGRWIIQSGPSAKDDKGDNRKLFFSVSVLSSSSSPRLCLNYLTDLDKFEGEKEVRLKKVRLKTKLWT